MGFAGLGLAGQSARRSTARPPRAPRVLMALCAVLAVASPLCLFLGTRGFAPVVGVAGLLCLPWARPNREDWRGVLILAALTLWAGISLAWSPAPNLHAPYTAKALSRFTILHMAAQLIFCTAFVTALGRLDGAAAAKALRWIALGFLLAPPLLIQDGLNHEWLYQALPALIHQTARPDWVIANLAQAAYVVAVMVWPLGVMLYRSGRLGLALALCLAAFLPLSMVVLRGLAPTVALAIGLLSFFLTLRFGPRAAQALGRVTAVYILATPLIMLAVERLGLYALYKPQVAPSWSDRLRIWGFVANQIKSAPLRGAGLDASRTFPGIVPLHPHDGALQLWYELGAPGAALGTLFWLWLWRRIGDCARRDPLYGATVAATATAYFTIGSVSFGLWQEWWLCVGAFGMTLCILLGNVLAAQRGGRGAARRHAADAVASTHGAA